MQIRQIQPEVIILNDSSKEVDMSSVVSRIMVNRSVNSPVGSCQITFEPSLDNRATFNITTQEIINSWRKYVKKNGIVAAKIDRTQKKYKFLGFIDQIIESDHSENQSVGRNLTINCSMLIPKLLVRDTIVNAPQLMTNEALKSDSKWSKRLDFFTWLRGKEKDTKENVFASTPEKAVNWILDNCIATNSEYTFGEKKLNAKAFIDNRREKDYNGNRLLDFQFLSEEKLFAPQLTMFTGTLLEYIYQCLDRDFYEIFFDATTLKNSGSPVNKITIRPKPFSRKNYRTAQEAKTKNDNWLYWENLPVRKINKSMRLRESISQADFEVKNFFRTTYENQLIASASSTAGKFGLNYPVMNLKSMEKYGIRELKTSSRMLNIEGQTQQEKYNEAVKNKSALEIVEDQAKTIGLFDKLIDKRNRVVEWYGFPNYETGQITLMGGYDEYNPGERLYYEDKIYWDEERDKEFKGVLYYINDVSEQANYSHGKYTVTLGLTRGAPAFEGSDDYVVKWFERHEADFIRIEKLPPAEIDTSSIQLERQPVRDMREALPKTMLEIPELKAE